MIASCVNIFCIFFFFNDTATTEIYTLSLHDALPISSGQAPRYCSPTLPTRWRRPGRRSEEHTSELQSPVHLVCRLLLEKQKHNLHQVKRVKWTRVTPISDIQ